MTGCWEIIELAVRSPAASRGEIRKITATGINATQSNEKPYLNGTGTLIKGTWGNAAMSTRPISHATTKPRVRPITMEPRRRNGLLKRLSTTMVSSTSAARPMLLAAPRSLAPKPPAMSVTATLISDKPIKVMMVPVTTGVISLRSLPMNWLSTTSINAAKKQMPKIVERISSVPPPRALTMKPALRITLIKEKLVP